MYCLLAWQILTSCRLSITLLHWAPLQFSLGPVLFHKNFTLGYVCDITLVSTLPRWWTNNKVHSIWRIITRSICRIAYVIVVSNIRRWLILKNKMDYIALDQFWYNMNEKFWITHSVFNKKFQIIKTRQKVDIIRSRGSPIKTIK